MLTLGIQQIKSFYLKHHPGMQMSSDSEVGVIFSAGPEASRAALCAEVVHLGLQLLSGGKIYGLANKKLT